MLLAHCSILPEKGEFLRDEGGPYIPRNEILEAIESALVFYLIKKDKALEAKVKKLILSTDTRPKLKALAKEIKKEVFAKYPYNQDLEIPQKSYLAPESIQKIAIERFDLKKREMGDRFESEAFKGVVEDFDIQSPHLQKIKTALLSFARGLAEYEHKELKGTILEPYITQLQNTIANEWQNTLRIGAWTKTPYKGDLLFFWRIKEVREKLLKEFRLDIRPKDIFFIPRYKEFAGWCEWC
jgi:hypothetical protein